MTHALTREAAGELRHELRTPINHILGYAEMLLEDAPRGSDDAAVIGEIIATARTALSFVNEALPPTGESTTANLDRLIAALAEPQARVLAAAETLSRGERDPQFSTDVERIAQAAQRLTAIPMAGAVVAREPRRRPSTPRATSAMSAASLGRILVVDDVEENRAVLERRLEREGYAVDSVASGEEALDRVAAGFFDLVLLDVLMPGLDGFAVLDRIKNNPATRNIPVIMISALDDLPSVVRCIEHGAEDFLSKPFDPVLLRARIGASLEKKRWHDREADYLRQVARVIEAASAVEQGGYIAGMLGAVTSRDDELGRLARVFDSMAAGVRARENRLREQLRELQADVNLATSEHFIDADTAGDTGEMTVGWLLAGRYEIRGIVGRGGMGVVYHARDIELNEDVAVKTIRSDLITDDQARADDLKSEIRLARRISHRNVVRTHDLGEAGGTFFVTMEYVRGITVRELLKTRGRLGVASTLALARQFAEALQVAHAAGVIHRDVKPENALVDSEGILKVMDFGIARLAETTGTQTQAGVVIGTPMYMAPEQLIGEAIDARADLYALGVVMYECLTGYPPFSAPSTVALIARVLAAAPVPPSDINPEVPPALSGLVLQLLAKDPAARPGDAHALLDQLAEMG